jgi:hypothetical protein
VFRWDITEAASRRLRTVKFKSEHFPTADSVSPLYGGVPMFIVQAFSNANDPALTLTLATSDEAVATVRSWQNRGKTDIRVIGDGRIYFAEEFLLTVNSVDIA